MRSKKEFEKSLKEKGYKKDSKQGTDVFYGSPVQIAKEDSERRSVEAAKEAFNSWLEKMKDPEFAARFEAEIAQDTVSCKKNLDQRRADAIRNFYSKFYTG